jgi:hypothetical protein
LRKEVRRVDKQAKDVLVDASKKVLSDSEQFKQILQDIVNSGKVLIDEGKELADVLVDEGVDVVEAGTDFVEKTGKAVEFFGSFFMELYEVYANPTSRGLSEHSDLVAKVLLDAQGSM